MWALAAELARLGDELTLAAVGEDRTFEGRWRDSVAPWLYGVACVAWPKRTITSGGSFCPWIGRV